MLADVLHDEVCDFLLRLAVGTDDQLVVARVVARRAGVFLHVVLAHLVHLVDNLAGLLGRDVLLARHSLHTVLHRCLDEITNSSLLFIVCSIYYNFRYIIVQFIIFVGETLQNY